MLKIDVITIFPQMFINILNFGVVKESINKNLCQLNIYDLRDFTKDRHKKVDDRPYGGGPGMVLAIQPVDDAVNYIKEKNKIKNMKFQKTILLSPQGEKLTQKKLKSMSRA